MPQKVNYLIMMMMMTKRREDRWEKKEERKKEEALRKLSAKFFVLTSTWKTLPMTLTCSFS